VITDLRGYIFGLGRGVRGRPGAGSDVQDDASGQPGRDSGPPTWASAPG